MSINTEVNNLSLTLILLVKGRNNFTERWLKYIDEINFKFPIIISDGANDGFVENLLNSYQFKNKINIQFKQFDTNSGFKKYYEMKRDTLKEVKTKYSMICDNDDFVIQNGLNQLINFLDSNEEYISASGKILNFEIDNWKLNTYGNLFFLPAYEYTRYIDPLNNWSEQLKSVFNNFQPNFYNIYRTEYLKKIFEETADINFSDLTMNEFFIQLRSVTMGKSKILNCHHYLRQRGTSQISNNFDFSSDLLKKNLPEDVRKLNKIFCEIVSHNKNEEKDHLSEIFEISFADYLRKTLAATMLRYRFPKLYKVKIFLKLIWYEKLKFISIFFKNLKNKIYLEFNLADTKSKTELNYIIEFLKKNGL